MPLLALTKTNLMIGRGELRHEVFDPVFSQIYELIEAQIRSSQAVADREAEGRGEEAVPLKVKVRNSWPTLHLKAKLSPEYHFSRWDVRKCLFLSLLKFQVQW